MKEQPISSGVLVGAVGGALLGAASAVFALGLYAWGTAFYLVYFGLPLVIAAVIISGLIGAAAGRGLTTGCSCGCGCFLGGFLIVLVWPVIVGALIGAAVGGVAIASLNGFIIFVRWLSRRGS